MKEFKELISAIKKFHLNEIMEQLTAAGINSIISDNPTQYLCNEAYWYLLKKYQGRAVLIHIPTIKHYITLNWQKSIIQIDRNPPRCFGFPLIDRAKRRADRLSNAAKAAFDV